MISPIGTTITAEWTPKFKRGKVRWNWAALLKCPAIVTHVLGVRTILILNVFVGEMLRLEYLASGCTQVTVTTKRLLKELALFRGRFFFGDMVFVMGEMHNEDSK